MALVKIAAPAGFSNQTTQVEAAGKWFTGNLVRWRQGALEKLPGWRRLIDPPFANFIRRMHAWLDLSDLKNILVGTDSGLQLVIDGFPITLSPIPLPDPKSTTWFVDNLGEDGLALYTHGYLYVYTPLSGIVNPIISGPSTTHGMLVAMPQAQVILWGTEAILGNPDTLDPLLLRFSDAGSYDSYTPAAGNMAGSYRLSRGSRIMGAIQAPQTTLIFTDTDVWSMSYIGPPLIYGFTIMGTGCGLVAPHAVATLGRTTYWQGQNMLWQFGDSGVQPVLSSVHDFMFDNLDTANINKCHAAANSVGNEVTFYFPSRTDPYYGGPDIEQGGTIVSNECNHYIKYNTVERAWDSGKLGRSAWLNSNIYGMPLGADLNYRIQQHETGFDDDLDPMRGVFVESGYNAIGDGTTMLSVDQCQPDFKWFGKNGAVNLSFKALSYAGSQPISYGPFSMTDTTQFFNPRVRGRHVAVRYDWLARKGFSARVGALNVRVKPAGRRP